VTVYLAVAGAGSLLLIASIVRSLFYAPAVELRGPRVSADDPNPSALVECNRDVRGLLFDLGTASAGLMAGPATGDDAEPLGVRWERFSREWRARWDQVDARCRFAELAGTDLGLAYDRMAGVHGDLPAMRLKYQSLLVSFDEEQADELARMRRALDLSLAALEKRAQGADR
jgi:hypothetical protein